MLIGLTIRDVVLVESLNLAFADGLTALTGETGAGKSIILDALGLAVGMRADAGLVRAGAERAVAAAAFALASDHPAWAMLESRGLDCDPAEDLVIRRQLGADGRSRAFVNDQAVSVAVLRELGEMLVEVHGQHETVGLLDSRTHRALLDDYGGLSGARTRTREAWRAWREAVAEAEKLAARLAEADAETELLTAQSTELERLAPEAGEEARLAEERAILGSAEKALADIAAARESLSADSADHRLAQAFRAMERARERALAAGAGPEHASVKLIQIASDAIDRAITELGEAASAVDAAAGAFEVEPGRLDRVEERLFALRAMARKLRVAPDELPDERRRIAEALREIGEFGEATLAAERAVSEARGAYEAAAQALSAARRAAALRLSEEVGAELAPLKLEKAQFRVAVEPLAEARWGQDGADRIAFEVSTNPGALFGDLGDIASGGELARLALALKASLASASGGPVMIFDEIDQGVGGAVADAVGQRLRRLAKSGQVLVVTHSPQIAARADAHWRVAKHDVGGATRTQIQPLSEPEREEELARMLAGAEITPAARAAARALMEA